MNSQKIVSIPNFYMEAMQNMDEPENVLKVPAEVTEWMHASMEDERVTYRSARERGFGAGEATVSAEVDAAQEATGAQSDTRQGSTVPITPVTVPPHDETMNDRRV